jgi:hypothetical protein
MTNTVDPYGIKNVNFSLIKNDDDRFEAYKKQRLERGFDDSEMWSLDCTIAKFIAPRLKVFLEHAEQIEDHPGSITFQEWKGILEQMIEGFEIYPDHFHWTAEESDANWKKVDKAFSLFHKWFFNLWN